MARKRLTVVDYECILEQLRAGTSARMVALKGLAGRRKVNEIVEAATPLGWLDPFAPMPSVDAFMAVLDRGSPVPVIPSKVEPHRAKVQELLDSGHQPKQIFDYLKRNASGFNASVGAVKRFCKRLQKQNPVAYVVMDYKAGEAAQVDFGSGPVLTHPETGKSKRTHVFIMTLCYSRHQYAEIVWDQSVETWLRCHRNAFEFFGGVVSTVVIDNLKSAITRACNTDPQVQHSYEAFARKYGFKISPCRPRTPRHKGRVESGVKYFKSSFLPLREYAGPGLLDANRQLMAWVLGEAGNRIHGTTHEVPLTVFAERESGLLLPLPEVPHEIVVWAKANLNDNCHLTFESSYYSAPHTFVDQELLVRAGERMVEIYHERSRVAIHVRATQRGTFRTNDAHYPPEKVTHLEKTPQWCLKQATDVGPSCSEFVKALLSDPVLDRMPAARRLMGLVHKYGAKRLESACRRALDHDALEFRAVKSILAKGLDQTPTTKPDPANAAFIASPRFARDIGRMLAGGAC